MANIISKIFKNASPDDKIGTINEITLSKWMVETLANTLKIDPTTIDTSKNFDSYGLDSMKTIKIAGKLEKLLEKRLSPALLFEYDSIDLLVSYLMSNIEVTE